MTWERTIVSPDGTHHVLDGAPLYGARFDEVLKFHAPGLAPVRRAGAAWHIRIDGEPAYPRKFLRVFGFYEGLAAAVSEGGWHHITPEGRDLYADRFAWCGNFQSGRCTVRRADGAYLHLTADGAPAYDARWRYAGDFRDGIAVVQSEDGRSTHIDRDGHFLHGKWFSDLDVFHKGWARARDDRGWTHVDREGRRAYHRRFSMVEPFYNGQARVETFDGGLEVVDETGTTITVLRPPAVDAFHALSADLVGYWRTETLAAAVRAGLFDVLPDTAAGVAARCGLGADGAARLLDALGELGVVDVDQDGRFRPTARGDYLASSHPLTLRDAALEYAGPLRRPWERLDAVVRGTESPTGSVFREVAASAERRRGHHRMLRSYAAHDYASLVERLPISSGDKVLDAGGGDGWLASQIRAKFPGCEIWLGDLPEVVSRARIEGVGRVEIDLFDPWPMMVDVVVLARVLHDWPDDRALRILELAKCALRERGRLVLIEHLRPDEGFGGALCDLHLLAVTGGRERRHGEWLRLLERGGFRVTDTVRGASVPSLLVGKHA